MTQKKNKSATPNEKILGLALQRVYFRGKRWLKTEKCSGADCPYRDAVQHFADLPQEALQSAGLEKTSLGPVGLIPLPRRGKQE
jgi:hypothetical protein